MTADELQHLRDQCAAASPAGVIDAIPAAILRELVAAYEAQLDSDGSGLRERGG